MLAAAAPLLLFVAFLLLLLLSLSAPIITSIFLFRIIANVDGATGSVNFGVWGYCISPLRITAPVFGVTYNLAGQCSRRHLGYTIDDAITNDLHISRISNVVSRSLTAALVLHPIAAALTLLTFLVSLFILRRGANGTSRLPSLLTLGLGLFTAILTTVVFLIDVILVAVARSKIHNDTHGDVNLAWGNAVWMALGAAIALWAAVVGACAGVCGCGNRYRSRKQATY